MSAVTAAEVEAAVLAFYTGTGDPAATDRWLTSFQGSTSAWEIALQLLTSSAHGDVRLFAATVLRQKARTQQAQLVALGGQFAGQQLLLGQLLPALVALATSPPAPTTGDQQKHLRAQLCAAAAALSLPHGPPALFASEPFAQLPLGLALEIMGAVGVEAAHGDQERMAQGVPLVLAAIKAAFAANMASDGPVIGGGGGGADPAGGMGTTETLVFACACLEHWARWGLDVAALVREGLLPLLVALLLHEEIMPSAAEALCEVVHTIGDLDDDEAPLLPPGTAAPGGGQPPSVQAAQQVLQTFVHAVEPLVAAYTAALAVSHHNHPLGHPQARDTDTYRTIVVRTLCTVLSTCCDALPFLCDSPAGVKIMMLPVDLLRDPCIAVSEGTFDYFEALSCVDESGRSTKQFEAAQRSLFDGLALAATARSAFPPAPPGHSDEAHDDELDLEEFHRFRRNISQVLLNAAYVLGSSVLDPIMRSMASATDPTAWRVREAVIFAVRCIAHEILPRVARRHETITSSDFFAVPSDVHEHFIQMFGFAFGAEAQQFRRLRQSTLLTAAACSVWFKQNPEQLQMCMQNIAFNFGPDDMESSQVAADCFRKLATDCSVEMVSIPGLLKFAEVATSMYPYSCGRAVAEGLVRLAIKHKDEALAGWLHSLTQPLVAQLQSLVQPQPAASGADAATLAETTLTTLAHLVKFLDTVPAHLKMQLMTAVWPHLKAVVWKFSVQGGCDSVSEAAASFVVRSMYSGKQDFREVLVDMLTLATESFQRDSTNACWLEVLATAFELFGSNSEATPVTQPLASSLELMTATALSQIQSLAVEQPSLLVGIIDAWFRAVIFSLPVAMACPAFVSIFELAVRCLSLSHRDPFRSACAFLAEAIKRGRQGPCAEQFCRTVGPAQLRDIAAVFGTALASSAPMELLPLLAQVVHSFVTLCNQPAEQQAIAAGMEASLPGGSAAALLSHLTSDSIQRAAHHCITAANDARRL
eukprot:m.130538 g.130538  ORF g.130538 m.130538 type:complete len:986 (+) comp16791_c0_seq7:80-3037(+)